MDISKKYSSRETKNPKINSVNHSKLKNFPSRIHFFLSKVLNLIDLAEKLAQTEAKLNLMSKFKEFFGGKFVNSRSFQKNLRNIKKNFRNFQKTHSKNSHAFLPKVKVLLAS